jgi:hypothetical protein
MDSDATLQEISNLFDAADRDKNNTLSREEVASIMTQIKKGVRPSDDELAMCMKIMDKNNDGVINKEEFTTALCHWMGLSSPVGRKARAHSLTSPVAPVTRKKAIDEMANFFRQFSPVADYGVQQQLILSRERPELNVSVIRYEFPVLPNERKVEVHKHLLALVAAGRPSILAELYSLDWNVVLLGVRKVKDLLSIVEVFHNEDEK